MALEICGLLIGLFFGVSAAVIFDLNLSVIGAGMGLGSLGGLALNKLQKNRSNIKRP